VPGLDKHFCPDCSKVTGPSGNTITKETFDTGAKRDTHTGKSRPDLISPFAVKRLGDRLAKGAEHYGERNWEKGMPVSRTIASLERHLNQYKRGCNDEDHLAAIMFNVMAIIHFEEAVRYGLLEVDILDLPLRQTRLEDRGNG
jgi:hypothetical protein